MILVCRIHGVYGARRADEPCPDCEYAVHTLADGHSGRKVPKAPRFGRSADSPIWPLRGIRLNAPPWRGRAPEKARKKLRTGLRRPLVF